MEERSVLQVGGTVEKAVKGEYNIDVKLVLNEAWENTKRSRKSINLGLLATLIIGMTCSLLLSSFMGGIEVVMKDQQAFAMLNLVVSLVVYPFVAGVEMMGVFHAVGLQTKFELIFSFLKRGSWVAICALMTSTLFSLGLALFYLPGIYLFVALSLVLPLVVEKKYSPLKAIVISLQATRHQWFQLFSVYLVMFLLLIACFIPILLLAKSPIAIIGGVVSMFALTYLAPLFYNVKGILYREIFGMQLTVANGNAPSNHSSFSA